MSEETLKPEELHKAMFVNLVMMLATSAMQAMGRLPDQREGKTAVNIEMARHSIDMLDMLAAKTKNNLDPEELRLLKETLSAMQLAFVEVANAAPAATTAADPTPTASETPGQPPVEQPAPGAQQPDAKAAKDAKEPKYRKKYG